MQPLHPPPAALTSPPHGSPGEASSEGGRFAARRPLPSRAATSHMRKPQASSANGRGANTGAAPGSGRRAGSGIKQVLVARSSAPSQIEPAAPTRPRVERPQPRLRPSLGPASCVPPAATNKNNPFVRPRPGGRGPMGADARAGASVTPNAVRGSPDSPPSLHPPQGFSGGPPLHQVHEILQGMAHSGDQFEDVDAGPSGDAVPGNDGHVPAAELLRPQSQVLAQACAVVPAEGAVVTFQGTSAGGGSPVEGEIPTGAALASEHAFVAAAEACADQAEAAALEGGIPDFDAAAITRDLVSTAAVAAANVNGMDAIQVHAAVTAHSAEIPLEANNANDSVRADVEPQLQITQQQTVESPLPAVAQAQPGAVTHPGKVDAPTAAEPPSGVRGTDGVQVSAAAAESAAPDRRHDSGAAAGDRDMPAVPPVSEAQPQKPVGWASRALGTITSMFGLATSSREHSAALSAPRPAALPDADRVVDSRTTDADAPQPGLTEHAAQAVLPREEIGRLPPQREDVPPGVQPGSADAAAGQEPSAVGDAVMGSETEDSAQDQGASAAAHARGDRCADVDVAAEPDRQPEGCAAGGTAEVDDGGAVPLDREMAGACWLSLHIHRAMGRSEVLAWRCGGAEEFI